MASISHDRPRLDQPDRLWLLPAPQARWLAAGLASGPLAAQLSAAWQWFTGAAATFDTSAAWLSNWLYLVWALGLLIGILGAFWRPGGLHIGNWIAVYVDYALRPRKAVWRPVGKGVLWW